MSIELLALILMLLHVGSVIFISFVIKRQVSLFAMKVEPYLTHFRKVLFGLSMIVLLGNIIPIAIDLLTILIDTKRASPVKAISIAYALSNAITSLVSAYLIWKLYRLAADTKEITDFAQHTLEKENKTKGNTNVTKSNRRSELAG